MTQKSFLIGLLIAINFAAISAQESNKVEGNHLKKQSNILKELQKFHLQGYGVVNYYGFDWDTDQDRRNSFDTERLNMYLKYDFTRKIQLKAEFEFEHGGTGVTYGTR